MEKCRHGIGIWLIVAFIYIAACRYVDAFTDAENLLTEFMVTSVTSSDQGRRSASSQLKTIAQDDGSNHQIDKRAITDIETKASASKAHASSTEVAKHLHFIVRRELDARARKIADIQRRALLDLSADNDEDETTESIASIKEDLKSVKTVLANTLSDSDGLVQTLRKAGKGTGKTVNEDDDYIPKYDDSLPRKQGYNPGWRARVKPLLSHANRLNSGQKWDRDEEIGEIFHSVMSHLHDTESTLKNLTGTEQPAEATLNSNSVNNMPTMLTNRAKITSPPEIDDATHIAIIKPIKKPFLNGNQLKTIEIRNFTKDAMLNDTLEQRSTKEYTTSAESELAPRPLIEPALEARLAFPTISEIKESTQHPSLNSFFNEENHGKLDGWDALALLHSLEDAPDEQAKLDEDADGLSDDVEARPENIASFLVPYRRIPIVKQLASDEFDPDDFQLEESPRLFFSRNTWKPSLKHATERAPADDLMLANYYDHKELLLHAHNTSSSTPVRNMSIDLEDPEEDAQLLTSMRKTLDLDSVDDDSIEARAKFDNEDIERPTVKTLKAASLQPIVKSTTLLNDDGHGKSKLPGPIKPQNLDVSPLIKLYFNVSGDNLTEVAAMARKNKSNENKIEFHAITNASQNIVCMDGSKPGYYMRRGADGSINKWIVHLHGGAWCYDLRSCLKRRHTILGSTKNWFKEDIDSFFHGILSRNYTFNRHYFDWNVVVLSYCDGGLFSGTRSKPITGKGQPYHFRGRSILQAQVNQLKHDGLANASDVILSGTSAGGLAVVLQGDFIRALLPRKTKVRGLVDAGFFLDQESVSGKQLARRQMKALYRLHRPKLNEKCILSYPPKQRYLCLFPENALRFSKLPMFFVNSLYDHWQLSELQGVYCVYKKVCERGDRDRILKFRKTMYNHLIDITKQKNDSGVFANSCLAHGQVILDYTWSHVRIDNRTIENAFNDWYTDHLYGKSHIRTDCRYPCNGSCPRILSQRCVTNFKGASELVRRKRNSELC